MQYTRKSLLSIDTNAKTVKGQKYGYMTGILYLAPYDLSGYQVCAMAKSAKCIVGCLNTAGRGVFSSIQAARINKTKYFFENREAFFYNLIKDIELLVSKAVQKRLIPLVRLNGTSDIKWEVYPIEYEGITYPNIFSIFPDVQFYDYTKLSNRLDIPENYDLTFSYSGVLSYQKYVNIAKNNNMRIAAVFRNKRDIPKKFLGLQCIDGDNSDIRHIDPKGVIVALYAKGKAKKDYSGFVVDKPIFQLMAA
jgi:hypothetical protein